MTGLRVQDCMVDEVVSCDTQASLEQAAHLMWTADCGVLPVLDADEQVLGVVTDRDLAMAAYLGGRPLRELKVDSCMSRTLHTCHRADSLEEAIRALGVHRVRRLPVVDELGLLEGVLAVNDIVRAVAGMAESRERTRLNGLLLASLASICELRSSDTVEPPADRAPKGALVEA